MKYSATRAGTGISLPAWTARYMSRQAAVFPHPRSPCGFGQSGYVARMEAAVTGCAQSARHFRIRHGIKRCWPTLLPEGHPCAEESRRSVAPNPPACDLWSNNASSSRAMPARHGIAVRFRPKRRRAARLLRQCRFLERCFPGRAGAWSGPVFALCRAGLRRYGVRLASRGRRRICPVAGPSHVRHFVLELQDPRTPSRHRAGRIRNAGWWCSK
ncbi:hypothetical protein ABIE91_006131 [Bradyrhizobium elkanii]